MKPRVLITGSNGFVGTLLVESLASSFEVIATARQPLDSHFTKLDISNINEVNSVFAAVKPNMVVHLAAMSSLTMAQKNPFACIAINVNGTKNLMEASIANGVSVFLNFSSNKSIYPSNIYGYTKALIDSAIKTLNYDEPSFFSYRCGNIVGSPDSFLDQWFTMQKKGETVRSSGGNAERFFITREEVVQHIKKLLLAEVKLSSTVLTPIMKSAKIADFLRIYEQNYQAQVERVESRVFDTKHDYLIAKEEAAYTQEIVIDNQPFYATGSTAQNLLKEAISTENNLYKLNDRELTRLLQDVQFIKK